MKTKGEIEQVGDIYDTEKFNALYEELERRKAKPEEIKQYCLQYRKNYSLSIKLLQLAIAHTIDDEKMMSELLIYLAALYFSNGICPNKLLKTLEECQDSRISLIRGFKHYSVKNYDEALFEFSKINYTQGINLCHVALREDRKVLETGDDFLRSFVSSVYWKKFYEQHQQGDLDKNLISMNDIFYRMGFSENYFDETNVDVQLKKIENDFITDKNTVEKLLTLKGNCSTEPYMAEFDYLIGKGYHIRKDYENAKLFYEKSLAADPSYLPAQYNLARLRHEHIAFPLQTLDDYNTLLALKNFDYSRDVSKCSTGIRKFFNAVVSSNRLESAAEICEEMVDGIENKKTRACVLSNLSIILAKSSREDLDKPRKMFERALKEIEDVESVADDRKDFIRFNLALVTRDFQGIRSGWSLEADQVVSFYSDELAHFPLLSAYTRMDDFPEEALRVFEAHVAKSESTELLYISICLAHLHLRRNSFKEALEICMKFKTSFYAANIIGVCYCRMGYCDEGLFVLEQVKELLQSKNHHFLPSVLINLANANFLAKKYRRCIENILMRVRIIQSIDKQTERLLVRSCVLVDDLKLVEHVLEVVPFHTIEALEVLRVQLLIKDNKYEEARIYAERSGISETVKEDLEKAKQEKELLAEKLKKIEEYRKSKKFY